MKPRTLNFDDQAVIPNSIEFNPIDETIPVFSKWLGSWQFSVKRRAFSVGELARHYDRTSADWHRKVRRIGFPEVYESLLRQAIGAETPSTVLDCGVGTGALSEALSKVLDRPFALTAVDVSPRMLAKAEEILRNTKARTVVCQANATELPFTDNGFDMVMTSHMLEHISEPLAALREMVRVLKPGGRLFACMTRRSFASVIIQLRWRTHRITNDEAVRLFHHAGLTSVESLDIDHAFWCESLSLACLGRKPL